MIPFICEIQKNLKLHKQRVEWQSPGAGSWGNEMVLVKGYKLGSWKLNKF